MILKYFQNLDLPPWNKHYVSIEFDILIYLKLNLFMSPMCKSSSSEKSYFEFFFFFTTQRPCFKLSCINFVEFEMYFVCYFGLTTFKHTGMCCVFRIHVFLYEILALPIIQTRRANLLELLRQNKV